MQKSRSVLFALAALASVSCKDTPTGPPPVASVVLTVPLNTLTAGSTQQLVAALKAANGAVLSGRTISWQSINTGVATVADGGLFTAIAPGTTQITATSEGISASAFIAVTPIPIATIDLVPATGTMTAGATLPLVATVRGSTGTVLTGRVLSWSSSSPAIATVDPDGVVTSIAPGSVVITAASENKTGTSALTITPSPDAPAITTISPATLIPGTTATITGARFNPAASGNRVTIRGVDATVLTASTTQLLVTVPCVSSGTVSVGVLANGRAASPVNHTVTIAARTIAVGQALVLTSSAASACNEFATSSPNARYLVAVFSASTSPNTLVDFTIAGNTPAPGAAVHTVASNTITSNVVASNAAAANTPFANTGIASQLAASQFPEDALNATRDDAHWRHLERDRAEYERVRRIAQQLPAPARITREVVLPAVGDSRDFFFTFNGGCTDVSRTMHTKAVYVGSRAIIWEDGENTLLSSANSDLTGYYQRLGQIFDQDQYQSLKNTFGDPLLRDSLTDGDGRVHMVFSQKLNGSGAAAYVTSCDQFPRAASPGGNFGEVFYGSVPITAGTNINSTNFPDGWFYFMARTVVHEVKHIVSQSARVQNNAPTFEQSWLEEGTARHAEEVWVRESLHHVAWKSNTGWGTAATNGVYCDFHPADATCNAADALRRPSYGMRRQFNEIREKLVAPWDWSPYGDVTTQSGSVFYQTAWSLVRYTIDRYAASDAAFFKTLINSSTNGTTNLAATAGASLDQLIGGWGLALYADDYPGLVAPSADLQFATWNLRDIYAGLNASPTWATRFPTAFPIRPAQVSFGAFEATQNGLRGGAHAYYEISGAAQSPQLIQVRGAAGASLPTAVRIAIARLQ